MKPHEQIPSPNQLEWQAAFLPGLKARGTLPLISIVETGGIC
jgi:hypothetical protein